MSFKCQSYMQFKALSAFLLQIGKMVLQSCLLSRDLSGKEGQDRGQEAGLSLFIVSSSLTATSVWPVSPCWLWLSDGLLGRAGTQRILNSVEPLIWGIGFLSLLLIPAASVTDLLLHSRWGSLLRHRWNEKKASHLKVVSTQPWNILFALPWMQWKPKPPLSHFFPQLYHLLPVFSSRPRNTLATQQTCCLTNLQEKDGH